jgi:hypothetical protein
MKRTKMTLTFPDAVIGELRQQAHEQGFLSPALYARYLITRQLKIMANPAGIERHHAGIFQDILDEVRKLNAGGQSGKQTE